MVRKGAWWGGGWGTSSHHHHTHHTYTYSPPTPHPKTKTKKQTDVIKAPLWDVAALGAAAYPSNAAYVQQFTANLLTTSFPNLRPQQVQVTGIFSCVMVCVCVNVCARAWVWMPGALG